MKRFLLTVICLLVLGAEASAHPRSCGGYRGYNGYHGYAGSGYGGYYGGYGGYYYTPRPIYYSSYVQSPAVIVTRPKPRPNIAITKWAEDDLIDFALNKFAFTRGLNRDGNQVILEIVEKDFHGDTGALKKVKFKVCWVEFRVKRDKDGREVREAKTKHDTIKLKFDEFGRFTKFCD